MCMCMCIYIYMFGINYDYMVKHIWGFPRMAGYPYIIHLRLGFPMQQTILPRDDLKENNKKCAFRVAGSSHRYRYKSRINDHTILVNPKSSVGFYLAKKKNA